MDNLKNVLDYIIDSDKIKENQFKEIELTPDKTIYFISKNTTIIIKGKISSKTVKPKGFILKMGDEYYYSPLDNKILEKSIIKEFVEKFLN